MMYQGMCEKHGSFSTDTCPECEAETLRGPDQVEIAVVGRAMQAHANTWSRQSILNLSELAQAAIEALDAFRSGASDKGDGR